METEDMLMVPVCVLFIAHAYEQLQRFRRRRPRSCWVRPWIQRRARYGAYHCLVKELAEEDHTSYQNFVRMHQTDFDDLLSKVAPIIRKQNSNMREAISPAERLSLTLRYLATGDSYRSLSFLYRVPVNTLSCIIPETCAAIYTALREEYLKVPDTKEEWGQIADDFMEKWNFPNCVGAMDGKHIAIKCPAKSGSTFYNYKQFFSIVLFAVVDANYKFLYVDVGCNGRISDGGVFANSSIFSRLEEQSMNFPDEKPLPGRRSQLPHVIVGDEAFPLKKYLMKPYPQRQLDQSKRIFNYRLSRARRIVENVFGILSSRFRILKQAIQLEPDKAEVIVQACCALHNFLRTKTMSQQKYSPAGTFDREDRETGAVTPGQWRQEQQCQPLQPIGLQAGNRSTNDAREIRDELCDFFNTNGQVPWQWEMI